jgi:hypothetical protein
MNLQTYSILIFLALVASIALTVGCGEPEGAVHLNDDNDGDNSVENDDNQYNANDPAVAVCGGGDATITGTVFAPDGSPLEGARVHVGSYRDRFDFDDDFNYRCNGAISRSDGSFELININPHDEQLRAIKRIDLGQSTFEQYEVLLEVDLSVGEEFEFDLHTDITRKADCGDPSGGSIEGVVYHGQTTTLPTARVVMLQNEECGTVAGTGGVYKLVNLPPRSYNIVFTQGRWRGMQTLDVEAGQDYDINLHIPTDD